MDDHEPIPLEPEPEPRRRPPSPAQTVRQPAPGSARTGATGKAKGGSSARPVPEQKCPQCGYSIVGLPSSRCPECGVDLPTALARDGRRKNARSQLAQEYMKAAGLVLAGWAAIALLMWARGEIAD